MDGSFISEITTLAWTDRQTAPLQYQSDTPNDAFDNKSKASIPKHNALPSG